MSIVHYEKKSFRKWWSTSPPISTKRTTPLTFTRWTQKGGPQHITLNIKVQALDKHTNWTGLKRTLSTYLSKCSVYQRIFSKTCFSFTFGWAVVIHCWRFYSDYAVQTTGINYRCFFSLSYHRHAYTQLVLLTEFKELTIVGYCIILTCL
jgi:hypothetical protein